MDQVVPQALRRTDMDLSSDTSVDLGVEHLSRRYHSVPALDDVSFSVAPGEVAALVGHSGSGKSTLLRLIAGLERPDDGAIVVHGRTVFGDGVFVPPEARGVGMMFQDYALFPHLTVMKNVLFGLSKRPAAEASDRANEALARVGLGDRANAYPHTLSGGEQQRVALARALAPGPRILLMDEPFSNLDRQTREMIRDDTARVLRDSGTTAVLVTHDTDDALRVADRILIMQGGRIVQDDSVEGLYHHPSSLHVARFFSDFNEVEGRAHDGSVDTPIGRFPAPALSGPAVACVRPKDIRLLEKPNHGKPGRVLSVRYLGETTQVELAVDGLDRPLRVAAAAGLIPRVGEQISFAIDPSGVLVFAV